MRELRAQAKVVDRLSLEIEKFLLLTQGCSSCESARAQELANHVVNVLIAGGYQITHRFGGDLEVLFG